MSETETEDPPGSEMGRTDGQTPRGLSFRSPFTFGRSQAPPPPAKPANTVNAEVKPTYYPNAHCRLGLCLKVDLGL